MKTIKELSQNTVAYATGYNNCKEDVLELIDEIKSIDELVFTDQSDEINAHILKARIKG